MKKLLALALLTIACAACAGGGARNVERSYTRAGLGELPLRTVDVYVFVSGPPRTAAGELDVKTFEPPSQDEQLAPGSADEATTRALIARVRAELDARGFTARISSPLDGDASPATTFTSSVATSTAVVAHEAIEAPGAARTQTSRTIAELRAESEADAVLIVRAVPVDSFNIDFGSGTKIETTALGRERVQDVRPVQYDGRLMLGQMFLFDRRTGLRLWTRQVPDFPDGGRLTENHPFLQYGYVAGPSSGGVPPAEQRAEPAARAFAAKMLADFPKAGAGNAEARAKLDSTDAAVEDQLQSFFDEGHFALEVDARFQHGPSKMELELNGQALPSLGTGALSPNGFFVVVPRVSYIAAGGWTFGVAVPIGLAPGSFSRTYHRDAAMSGGTLAGDDNARVEIGGGSMFGVDLTAGPTLVLSPSMFLLPHGGIFYESVSFDASPSSVVRDASRSRFGVLGGADLRIRASATSAFFGRAGAGLRVGYDLSGSPAFGVDLSAGVGVIL